VAPAAWLDLAENLRLHRFQSCVVIEIWDGSHQGRLDQDIRMMGDLKRPVGWPLQVLALGRKSPTGFPSLDEWRNVIDYVLEKRIG